MSGRRAKAQHRQAGGHAQRPVPASSRVLWQERLTVAGVLTGALIPFVPTSALALPQGGTVAAGAATISTPTATSMRIDQTTDRASLDWTRFNIAANESVHFQQPSAASIALNRVSSQEPSAIFGALSANGQIFLLNPSGILFGASSRVDVGALTASTLTMSNQDFLNSQYRFTQDPNAANAAVVNQGLITASSGGYVALLGAAVRNEGVIQARLGSIALAAGKAATLDMRGDGLIQFVITDAVSGSIHGADGQPVTSYVSNTGTLQADGGMVTLQAKAAAGLVRSVVNQKGVIRAASLVNHAGVIKLLAADDVANTGAIGWQANLRKVQHAAGTVTNYGTLDVSAGEAGAAQGQVALAGEYVGHAGTILARGADQASGGRVLLTSTKETVITKAGSIDTSGGEHSSAGNVVVWSDTNTIYQGQITARGGAWGGDGGNAEVSGYHNLNFRGTADLSALHGRTGSLLLDPTTITITGGSGDGAADGTATFQGAATAGTIAFTDATPTTVYESEIEGLNADIVLQASQTITTSGTFGSAQVLLQNNRNLTVQTRNQVGDGAGGIDLTASADGANLEFKTQGTGTISITGSTDGGAAANVTVGKLTTASGQLSLTTNNGTITVNGAVTTSNGNISMLANNNITLNIGGTVGASTTGVITISADTDASGAGTLTTSAAIGNPAAGAITLSGNDIALGASVTGSGALTISPSTAARNITIGADNASEFALSPLELTYLTDGFSSITIGRTSDGTGTITFYPSMLTDPVTFAGGSLALTRTSSRVFDGISDYMVTSSTVDLSGTDKLTLAFWLNWNAFSNDDSLAFESTSIFNFNTTGFLVDPNSGSTGGKFEVSLKGNTGFVTAGFTRPSAGVWHRYAIMLDKGLPANEVTSVYVDGVSQTLTFGGNSDNTNNFGNDPLYFMSRGGGVLFGAGKLANVQLFNRNLTPSEAEQALTAPGSVRTGLSLFYTMGNGSPEIDSSGNNNNGTVSGTTLSANTAPVTILNTGANPLTLIARTGNIQGSGIDTDIRADSAMLTAQAGSLTGMGGITASGSGAITLTATGASSNISLSGPVDIGSGVITLLADNNITLNSGGSVGASSTGTITISADNDASGAGTLTTSAAIGNAADADTITLSGATIALGASVTGSGALLIQPSTASRTIGIGTGAGLFSLSAAEVAFLTNGFTGITIGRSNGTGTLTSTAITFNDPVTWRVPAGTITLSGLLTGADNASVNLIAASVNPSSITTSNNPITITASDGGIAMTSGALSSGTGDITLTGTGAVAGSYGIHLSGGGPTITTTSGNISLTGIGTVTAPGMRIANVGTIISTTTGAITITGTGGPSAAGVSSHGVHLDAGAIVRSTSNSTITITGTAGTGDWAGFGIRNQGGTVSAVNGAINLVGYGMGGFGATNTDNYGVVINSGGLVQATGNATISITGTGSPFGTNNGVGVQVSRGGIVSVATGALIINGTGAGSGTGNIGVAIDLASGSSGLVRSTGTGPITIVGVGGAGSSDNAGIRISAGTSKVTSVSGAVDLQGTGHGSGTGNYGIVLVAGAKVESTGAAALMLTGTGAAGAYGIVGTGALSTIGGALATGPITLTTDLISLATITLQTSGTGGIDITTGGPLAVDQALSANGTGAVTLNATGVITGAGGISSGGTLTLNASSVGTAATPLTLTALGGGLSGTLSGSLLTDVFNVKSTGALTINLGLITATAGTIGHAVTVDSTLGSVLHGGTGTNITGGRVNFWGTTIGTVGSDILVATDNPPVYCNGTPCGSPYYVNLSAAPTPASTVDTLFLSLPDTVLNLLNAERSGLRVLSAGVLPENIYACLDQKQDAAPCSANAIWREDERAENVMLVQEPPHSDPRTLSSQAQRFSAPSKK